MKRMSAKTLSLLISAVLLFSVVIIPQSIAAPQLEKVNFLLNWKITGDHSPYYVALKKGWYADVGLDVNVIVGQGSGYSVQAVDSGKADIAISDAPVPISSREKGAKVKIIGVIFDKHPNCTYFWKNEGIKEPKDLVGKTVAVPATDGHKVMFPAFAKLVGVDAKSVTFVNIEPAAKVAALASKKADAVFELYTGKPFMEAAIPPEQLGYFLWADYGFNCYAHSYITSDTIIAKNPEMLKKFLNVSYKAWEYTCNNPQEAINILAEYHPINKAEYNKNLETVLEFVKTDRLRAKGLGYIEPAQIKSTYDLVNEYQSELSFPVTECFDDRFLPDTPYTNF
ncbi:MAG: ABC transporter substrate-binding protein [Firmicutes bacterium]|nr:ABC transporter substrate-binding protein [Bacillota bacterium]